MYIICDYSMRNPDGSAVGWAVNDPIEGWIFTRLKNSAERFKTIEEAKRRILESYSWAVNYLKVERIR